MEWIGFIQLPPILARAKKRLLITDYDLDMGEDRLADRFLDEVKTYKVHNKSLHQRPKIIVLLS